MRNARLNRELNARSAAVTAGKAYAGGRERNDEAAANREHQLPSPTLSPPFRSDRGRVFVDLARIEGGGKRYVGPRLRVLMRVGHIGASPATSYTPSRFPCIR
jgi:hypothetical protein